MQLILFDIDGTLLHPHGVGRESTRRAMLEIFGTTGNLATHQFGGKTDWLTLMELLTEAGYDERAIGDLMPAYEKAVARHLREIADDFPIEACVYALDVVAQIRQRDDLMMGLVTGNVSSTAPIKLQAAGYDPAWFTVGAYGSEAPDRNRLPALALQRAIAFAQRDIHPADVIIVGDTPADVQCARALGARAIAVATGFASRETLQHAKPDALLPDLSPLLRIL